MVSTELLAMDELEPDEFAQALDDVCSALTDSQSAEDVYLQEATEELLADLLEEPVPEDPDDDDLVGLSDIT